MVIDALIIGGLRIPLTPSTTSFFSDASCLYFNCDDILRHTTRTLSLN